MADLKYKATVDVTQAERSLGNLQKAVGNLNDNFIRFRTVVASISLGALIQQSLAYAAAIEDISGASGIATENIIGFQKAVQQFGGSAEAAQKGILRLVNSIGEAAEGSISMQQAFKDVGVSLDDLRRLSEQDLLAKTIEGLDKISDRGRRSLLITQLLGKEFRGVEFGGLAAAYAKATQESSRYAAAIQSADKASEAIDKSIGQFKIALLDAIKPVTDLVKEINIGVEGFKKFIQALLAIGAALASFLIIGRIAKLFVLFFDAIVAIVSSGKNLVTFLKELATGWRAIYSSTEGVGGVFARLLLSIKAVGVVLAETLGPAFTALKGVAAPVLAALAGYWGWIQDSTESALRKLREYASILSFGLISPPGAGGGRGDGQAELEQRKKDAEEAAKKEQELREVLDRQAATRAKIRLETDHQIDNLAIGLARQVESIKLEGRLIELSKIKNVISEDEVEIYKAISDLDVQRLAAVKRLEQENEKLRLQAQTAKAEELDGIFAQIAANDRLIAKTKEYYIGQVDSITEAMTYLQSMRKLDAARLQDQENIKKAIEDQIQRQQSLGDILRQVNNETQKTRQQIPVELSVSMTSIQKQVAEIQERVREAALEAGRTFAAGFEDDGEGLTPERARELADGLDQIGEAYRRLAETQIEFAKQQYEVQRTFEFGWKDALTKFAEEANDRAKEARTYFDTFVSGFENAIVRFVQTGKLNFKDLVNSLIADFARIQARRMLFNFLGASGLGNLFGGGGSTLAGPALLGLPGFAKGGYLPSGQMGIVGEQGPELITGPANIVPFDKMQQPVQVTYNINAVDASSFRALVARDPQFIYNISEQGRRSQPARRLS